MARAAFCFALAAVFAAACFAQGNANAQCFQNANRRNHKDLYADATDCHNYYQCFYHNETHATGILRKCPAGSFWHDAVLSCLPEGSTPCVDRCLDTSSAKSCFAGNNCRHFYVCANTGSYGMCCPEGTVFNEATCSCDESATCHDACSQDAPLVKTTVRPAVKLNDTHCTDSWGNTIRTISGLPNAYFVVGDDGSVHDQQFCPTNILFDLDTCRCDIEGTATAPTPTVQRQAIVWLSFDANSNDQSVNKFSTFAVDGAQRDTATSAFGGASLAVNGGYLSLPGLKSHDFRNAASFCLFYRCSGTNAACTKAGGLLSNNKDNNFSEYTVVLAQNATDALGRLNFWQPVGSQATAGNVIVPSNGWNHVCLVYNSNSIVLHVNGNAGAAQFVGGFLQISSQELVVGTDAAYGPFSGNIDDVLITGFAMTQAEIDAHRTGDRAYLASRGFF